MKRRISCVLLALVFTLLLGGNALAAETTVKGDQADIVVKNELTGVSAVFAFDTDPNKKGCIHVTITDTTEQHTVLKDNTQYLILMVDRDSKDSEDYTINENTIKYIDQKAPTSGVLTFDVFPSSITNSVILICGTEAGNPVKLAIVNAKYILGDVDGSGGIAVNDAVQILKKCANIIMIEGNAALAADIDGNGRVEVNDAVQILKICAGIIPKP